MENMRGLENLFPVIMNGPFFLIFCFLKLHSLFHPPALLPTLHSSSSHINVTGRPDSLISPHYSIPLSLSVCECEFQKLLSSLGCHVIVLIFQTGCPSFWEMTLSDCGPCIFLWISGSQPGGQDPPEGWRMNLRGHHMINKSWQKKEKHCFKMI